MNTIPMSSAFPAPRAPLPNPAKQAADNGVVVAATQAAGGTQTAGSALGQFFGGIGSFLGGVAGTIGNWFNGVVASIVPQAQPIPTAAPVPAPVLEPAAVNTAAPDPTTTPDLAALNRQLWLVMKEELGRVPSALELARERTHVTEDGWSVARVRMNLEGSDEAKLNAMYRDALKTDMPPAERIYWVAKARNGMPLNQIDEALQREAAQANAGL